MLVSDTIDVAGLPTTGGSLALKDVVPAQRRRARRAAEGGGSDHPRQGQRDRAQRHGRDRHAGRLRLAARAGAEPVRHAPRPNSASGGAVAAAATGLAAATVGVEADAATTGTSNPTNSASISAAVPAAASAARSRSGRRSGCARAPASCRRRARRRRRRRSGAASPTSPCCCPAWSVATRRRGDEGAPATAPDYFAGLSDGAGGQADRRDRAHRRQRCTQRFTEARGRDHDARRDRGAADGAEPPERPPRSIDREFKRDLDAYLAPYGKIDRGDRRLQRRPRGATR